ncbi:lipopolysaccharide assembly protein LapA domain-containing protein [Desulfatitalea alkaliphila]|uniref:Lipopolysaccharide assembly protein LapA domain-containing protein n=1 Tax=Desulfatitalea alkaliphila TaxID=2929485 RepID=A0AA41UIV4_9BACT|nr:lipopolysaccharide assembly protein LapA domain-containing protein [Desulfatitalea alkaliphila]MCJ8500504.1 lipopolysaccharide assembly protein LapA domain-containing protein [Desulfatitalea alkaliphila]
MKKVKLVFWIVILALLGLIVYQNRDVLLTAEQPLSINLGFGSYQTPALPFVIYFLFFFVLGWLIAFLFGFVERIKTGKKVKKLKDTINSQAEAITAMKKDIETLKPHTGHKSTKAAAHESAAQSTDPPTRAEEEDGAAEDPETAPRDQTTPRE